MDSETGEITQQLESRLFECSLDEETGEIVGKASDELDKQNTIRKPKFSVPKSYIVQPLPENPKTKCCLSPSETYTLTSQQKVLELKEVMPQKFINRT